MDNKEKSTCDICQGQYVKGAGYANHRRHCEKKASELPTNISNDLREQRQEVAATSDQRLAQVNHIQSQQRSRVPLSAPGWLRRQHRQLPFFVGDGSVGDTNTENAIIQNDICTSESGGPSAVQDIVIEGRRVDTIEELLDNVTTGSERLFTEAVHWQCPHCAFKTSSQRGVSIHRTACHGYYARRIYAGADDPTIASTVTIPSVLPSEGDSLTAESLARKWSDLLENWAYDAGWVELDKFDHHIAAMLKDFAALSAKLWPIPVDKTIQCHRNHRAARKLARLSGDENVMHQHLRSHRDTNKQKRKMSAAHKKQQRTYDQAQWKWKHKRKSIAQGIMNPDSSQCTIEPSILAEAFHNVFGVGNDKVRETHCYPIVSADEQALMDESYNDLFSTKHAAAAIKSIGVDKSPGPDKVSMKVIKEVDASGQLHSYLAMAVQRLSYYPTILRRARTVLIFKGGDEHDGSSWRPITIFSMTRRIINKMFERRLRKFIKFSHAQRGFTSQPGCLLNISRLAGILRHARITKAQCHAVLLDIRKAFDSLGHAHIRRVLASKLLPSALRNVAAAAIKDNITRVRSKRGLSREIVFAAGVPQGEPLSPLLFNLAIDFIIEKLAELNEECGYNDGDGSISVLAFADDTTIVGRDGAATQKLLHVAEHTFAEIGLRLNASKTKWLPSPAADEIVLYVSDQVIAPVQKSELVRYLGAHFKLQNGLSFDAAAAMQQFHQKFERIIQTTLLTPYQKLQLMRQYLMPIMNFSFQVAPLWCVADTWLRSLDLIITNGLREILLLPNGSCNAMYYAPRALSGLAMVRFVWEARLQRLSALPVLLRDACAAEKRRAVLEEAMRCFDSVQMETSADFEQSLNQPNLSSNLRKQLRMRSHSEWVSMDYAGYGAEMYQAVPASNRWLAKKSPMTLNEWLMSIQLRVNACGVYVHPRMQQQHDPLCRRCHAKFETIGHVIGSCESNMGMIINRHNEVVELIAVELRRLKYTVYVERRCVGRTARPVNHEAVLDAGGDEVAEPRWMSASRRIDIVAVTEDGARAFLIDPTIRIESSEESVDAALQEKKNIYEPTIAHFQEELAVPDIEVHGVWFGSRGAHHATTVTLFRRLGVMKGNNSSVLDNITKVILKHSAMIMRNHLYHSNDISAD